MRSYPEAPSACVRQAQKGRREENLPRTHSLRRLVWLCWDGEKSNKKAHVRNGTGPVHTRPEVVLWKKTEVALGSAKRRILTH